MATNDLRVTCPECGSSFPLEQAVDERPIPDSGGVVLVGVVCPGCQMFMASYADSPALARGREKLRQAQGVFRGLRTEAARRRMERATVRYQSAFDALQERWKPKPSG